METFNKQQPPYKFIIISIVVLILLIAYSSKTSKCDNLKSFFLRLKRQIYYKYSRTKKKTITFSFMLTKMHYLYSVQEEIIEKIF